MLHFVRPPLSGSFLRRSLFAGTMVVMCVTPALAQSASGEPESGVPEIIVTAQKRAENLQDVPISVATLSGDGLETLFNSGDDILALASRVPSLNIESSNGRVAPRFYIRGLGNTDFDLAASQPVSVIIDDVVLENVVLKSSPLFDLASVEVLRGPQGTLFGRNTPAGIVKFATRRPEQEFQASAALTVGRFNTVTAEAAVGGGVIQDKLAIRVSGLAQHRDNYIDNIFTNETNVIGGYDEYAGRVQLLFTPVQNFSALLNVHGRSLDGTSALFRANIIGPGSNRINQNFNRFAVQYDGGANNIQQYDGYGVSLNWDYDFGPATFTAISAYENTNGAGRGDIDGGSGAVFLPGGSAPGIIPFPSDTIDGIDNLGQYTQEVRLASNGKNRFNWQIGAYFFNSSLTITTNPFFAPPTTVFQDNTSWAGFGQADIALGERWTIAGGLRYTTDNKNFRPIATNLPVPNVSVNDNRLTWDTSVTYKASEDVNLYWRAARGFRAPSIQGRDVAFFGQPSVAQSETVISYEGGLKSEWLQGKARTNATAFYYTIRGQQLSAIGGLDNLTRLINADRGVGWGIEVDTEFAPTEHLFFTAGVSYNNTELKDPNLRVAVCAQCTVLDRRDATGQAIIDGNPFPQAPRAIANVTGRYAIPVQKVGEFFVLTDWAFQTDANFFLYQSAEFHSGATFEGGVQLGYKTVGGNLEFAFFVRNVTNEVNLKGGIDFNNLTGFVNEPRVFGFSLKGKFH